MVSEEELLKLGDPSGHQDAAYWNQWFHIVCGEKQESFEWYCDVKEVMRMLDYHGASHSQTRNPRIIHPGSGNSLVPVQLRDTFALPHEHVVVDISDVALAEMQEVHDTTSLSSAVDKPRAIEYIVGDILQPPLPLDSNGFDVWLDKGLLDALFKDAEASQGLQCQALFEESHRLLRPDHGMMLIVTLAEDHSLRLIIDNWKRNSRMWKPTFHVWELEPISGEMRPFGFVAIKKQMNKPTIANQGSECAMVWHNIVGKTSTHTIGDGNDAFQIVKSLLDKARQEFKRSGHVDSGPALDSTRKVLATLEIKPTDDTVDLKLLSVRIVESKWFYMVSDQNPQQLSPQWQKYQDANEAQASVHGEIVPIGYGISKLLMRCVISSEELDALVESIEEWDINEGRGQIQSVDVDWEATWPVGDLPVCVGSKNVMKS